MRLPYSIQVPLRTHPDVPAAGIGVLEILAWCVSIAIAIGSYAYRMGGPGLQNDSYQYISAAENFAQAPAARTSIVYFDVERSHGVAPAPLTTFPAGYPLIMSAVAALGVTPDFAGLVVSLVAACSVAVLLAWGARWLQLGSWTTRALLLLLLTNSTFVIGAGYVLTEPLFTAVTLAALLFLIRAQTPSLSERSYLRWLMLAQLAIASAYWVRYAGLFLFAGAATYLTISALRERSRRAWLGLASVSVSAVLIGLGFARNYLLVGSWKGGNTKSVHNDLWPVLHDFFLSIYHVLLGEAAPASGALELLLALAVAGAIALYAGVLYRNRSAVLRDRGVHILAAFLLFYVTGMIYLGMESVISFGTRMFKPLLPVLLLFGAIAYKSTAVRDGGRGASRIGLAALFAVSVAGYMAINLRSYVAPPEQPRHSLIRAQLDAPLDDGRSLVDWIDRNLTMDRPLFATDGQATGYLLKRKVVALTSAEYSDQAWTADAVRATMERFDATHLIIYYGLSDQTSVIRQSPFLQELSRGALPDWLRVVADNHKVRILAMTDPNRATLPTKPVVNQESNHS